MFIFRSQEDLRCEGEGITLRHELDYMKERKTKRSLETVFIIFLSAFIIFRHLFPASILLPPPSTFSFNDNDEYEENL